MANTLLLRLEGPYQSWGERAQWGVRDTASEPTKSGVVGLLACACGYSSDEELSQLSQQLQFGVRCDKPGVVLIDYHTIFGGVLSAEGKIKGDTVLSWRAYLYDASFLVVIRADPLLIEKLAQAVQEPVWPIYLGRKACIPSQPIFEGVGDYANILTALQLWPLKRTPVLSGVTPPFRAVLETTPGQGAQRRDEIVSRKYRTFLPRYTTETLVSPPIVEEEIGCI